MFEHAFRDPQCDFEGSSLAPLAKLSIQMNKLHPFGESGGFNFLPRHVFSLAALCKQRGARECVAKINFFFFNFDKTKLSTRSQFGAKFSLVPSKRKYTLS